VESENIQTVRRYFDACNSGNLDDFATTLATDVVHYFLPERFAPIRGAEHLARFWRKFKQVSNTVWAIDQIIGQHDNVVSEWSLIWSPRGTTRRLMMRGTEWYVVRAGRIAEVRAYFAYDEERDAELPAFPYEERRYLLRALST
jgi:ketosteroid isomerase-like protein